MSRRSRTGLLTLTVVVAATWSIGLQDARAVSALKVTALGDDAPDGCKRSGCTLREAILAANKTKGIEKIILSPGTHLLTIAGADEDAGATGDLDVRRSVKISGTPGETVIQQTTDDRIFDVLGKAVLKITGVELTGGDGVAGGGAVRVSDRATAKIASSRITNNAATHGGGIFSLGDLTVIDSVVDGNTASGGGGISADTAKVRIVRSKIHHNDATNGHGGGAYLDAPGALTVFDSDISYNTASFHGGGIYVDAGEAGDPGPDFTLLRSSVTNNGADHDGGGLYLRRGVAQTDGEFVIENSTIAGNGAVDEGGGFFCLCPAPGLRVIHTTITDNAADANNSDADERGAGFMAYTSRIEMLASIVAGNREDGVSDPDCAWVMVFSLGANVFGDPGCAYELHPTDTIAESFFKVLADNGGPTPTVAIEAGDLASDRHQGKGCTGTDQRGAPRMDGACDAGAYELTYCGNAVVNIVGTPGHDLLEGTAGNDGVLALAGNDVVRAGDGDDWVCGGKGNDRLYGEDGDDFLFGEGGDDLLDGGPGIDNCVDDAGKNKKISCEAI